MAYSDVIMSFVCMLTLSKCGRRGLLSSEDEVFMKLGFYLSSLSLVWFPSLSQATSCESQAERIAAEAFTISNPGSSSASKPRLISSSSTEGSQTYQFVQRDSRKTNFFYSVTMVGDGCLVERLELIIN